MKITKKYLLDRINEELQKEIFGFRKKKSEESLDLPNVKAGILSRLISLKVNREPMDSLLKQFPELDKVKDKSFGELNKIYGDLVKKEKEQKIADQKAAKAKETLPSYSDPSAPDWRDDLKKFQDQERRLKVKINTEPDKIPDKPKRNTDMDKQYPSGIRPGMTERKNK